MLLLILNNRFICFNKELMFAGRLTMPEVFHRKFWDLLKYINLLFNLSRNSNFFTYFGLTSKNIYYKLQCEKEYLKGMNCLDRNVEINLLIDFYGNMLTERQREIMVLYYEDNLSLSEIAKELGISKQGVADSIRRSEKTLYDTEAKLQLLKQYLEN